MGGSSQSSADAPPDAIFQVRVMNAGNSCYLDSVLFAMFAMPSQLDSLLTKPLPAVAAGINTRHKHELQASISKNFVMRMRAYETVTVEMISNIRHLCRRCGWEYMGAADQQQDAGEFFSFLHGALGGQELRLRRKTFTGALPDNSDKGHEENMSILPVPMDTGSTSSSGPVHLSSLLDSWFYENVADGLLRKVSGLEQEVVALNTYSIENVPMVVAVSLKRFDKHLNKSDAEVNFPDTIHLHKYSSRPEWRGSAVMQAVPWNLRSVVCHRGRVAHSGHYYAYTRYSRSLNPNSVWLRFDDASSPCITQHANVCDDPYARSECMLFIYELDIDAHTASLMLLEEEEEQRGLLGAFGMLGDEWGVAGWGGSNAGFGGSSGGLDVGVGGSSQNDSSRGGSNAMDGRDSSTSTSCRHVVPGMPSQGQAPPEDANNAGAFEDMINCVGEVEKTRQAAEPRSHAALLPGAASTCHQERVAADAAAASSSTCPVPVDAAHASTCAPAPPADSEVKCQESLGVGGQVPLADGDRGREAVASSLGTGSVSAEQETGVGGEEGSNHSPGTFKSPSLPEQSVEVSGVAASEDCEISKQGPKLSWSGASAVEIGSHLVVIPSGGAAVLPVREERYDKDGCQAWTARFPMSAATLSSDSGVVAPGVCVCALDGLDWGKVHGGKMLLILHGCDGLGPESSDVDSAKVDLTEASPSVVLARDRVRAEGGLACVRIMVPQPPA